MRWVIVSNRLPVTLARKRGAWEFKASAGGLASGINGYLHSLNPSSQAPFVWIGWPGSAIEKNQQKKLSEKMRKELHYLPVFLDEKEIDGYYHGFCNRTIWPLFHCFPTLMDLEESFWESYQKAQKKFCDALLSELRPGDVVWIHDFHLMLLPGMIRAARPDVAVGFFLHVPFPPFEIFQLLPRQWRTRLLEGLLGADLIGFHTYDYTHAFTRCLLRYLGLEQSLGYVHTQDRMLKADTFPLGIDFDAFFRGAGSRRVLQHGRKIRQAMGKQKLVLSLDRLDYTKGILNRLRAYELFLEKYPEWRKKVTLLLILVPSRTPIELYQEMKKQIDEIIGKINGRFGTLSWSPVVYQYRSVPFDQLVALYSRCDVALITPLRDGMNLVAKEYLAARRDGSGVLILSEMAGASRELGEALLINPNSLDEIVQALAEALTMPPAEQVRRNRAMQERLRSYNVAQWGHDFFRNLQDIKSVQEKFRAKLLNPAMRRRIYREFHRASRRWLFLDYDGTLVSFYPSPEQAKPQPEVLRLLKKLTQDPRNRVVLISGRNRNFLRKCFGKISRLNIVAEHGVWLKEGRNPWRNIRPLHQEWKAQVLSRLQLFADRLPGAFVEEKEFSLVWHFRKSEPELAALRERELIDDLLNLTANLDLQVLPGNKIVEVRSIEASKSTAVKDFLVQAGDSDFFFAIGDDSTDEDLFRALPERGYSLRVGLAPSHARFNLADQTQVLPFLRGFSGPRA